MNTTPAPTKDENDDLTKRDFDSQTDLVQKPPVFSDMSFATITIGVFYIIGLSLLLAFFYKAGKYSEYTIPFYMIEANLVNIAIISSILGIASLSAYAVVKLSLPPNTSHIKHRTQKITDFFAALTTLSIAFYFITIISLLSKVGVFPIESLYLFLLYILMVSFYFMKKRSYMAYNLVISGFIIVLLITSFYLGINTAKTEDKLITTIDNESYVLVANYSNNFILSGYKNRRFNGKIRIITPDRYQSLVFTRNKN
ncbi:MAG: hypothetical protein AB7U85_03455 [Alphaproteobacteria bacterium]